MFLAMGWAIIQSSRQVFSTERYRSMDVDRQDVIMEEIDRLDDVIFDRMQAWLDKNLGGSVPYQFSRRLNYNHGLFQFHTARNHRCRVTYALADFIAKESKGSHGIFYTSDSEAIDFEENPRYEVVKIFEGKVTIKPDHHFSPFTSVHTFEIQEP